MRFAVLPVLLLFLAACERPAPTVQQGPDGQLVLGDAEALATSERSVTPAGRTLVVENFNGTIDIGVSDGPTALLRFTRRARGTDEATAADVLAGVTVTETAESGRVRFALQAQNPSLAAVDVRGTIPRGTYLDLVLESGTVSVRGVDGPLRIRLANGTVQVTGSAAPVDVQAQNATIDVSVSRLTSGVTLASATGPISLGLPPGASAAIDAQTQLGSVLVDGLTLRDRRLDTSGMRSRLTGRLGTGTHRVGISALNGDVSLHPAVPDAPAPDTLTGAIPAPVPGRPARVDSARRPPLVPGPPRDTGATIPDPGIRLPDTLRLR